MFKLRFRSSSFCRLVCCVTWLGFGCNLTNVYSADVAKSPTPATTTPSKAALSNASNSNYDPELVELYRSKQLFKPENYEKLRHIVAKKFIHDYTPVIRKVLGEDYEEMNKWCEAHVDIFEEFCCSIHEKYDDVGGAFSVFNEIRKKFPDQIEKYHNLAIATAVVWDDGSKSSSALIQGSVEQAQALYDDHNEIRSIDNFAYFVENEKYMQDRALKTPWEALTYIVYQRTSAEERKWVLEKYGQNQKELNKIYTKVPYDGQMWSTRFKNCKLKGKPYTLENIVTVGGICVQRSDFSSRVAMNLAYPASRVNGVNDDHVGRPSGPKTGLD